MPAIKVEYGQTLVDLALQSCGDESRLFELADLNGIGVTDDLVPGNMMNVPEPETKKQRIANLLRDRKPASGVNPIPPGGELNEEGIEFWALEVDFIVS
jgi:hypothetical protein